MNFPQATGKDAGIDELVEIEVTNGGTPRKVWKPKYELVHTHTARRYALGKDYTPSDIKDVVSPVVSKLTERQ